MKKTFYIYKSGTLKRKDNSICLVTKTGTDYIPVEQVDCIVCFSEVSMNKRFLAMLNTYGIELLFFNYYGSYIGKYVPKTHKDGKILVHQTMAYTDTKTRVDIAHSFLKGSFMNMLAVLKYYRKKGKDLEECIDYLSTCVKQLYKIDSIETLLLLEARAKKVYYSAFDTILDSKEFVFDHRSVYPPKNEVNAMLSYGYAVLYGTFLAILERSSLEPQISFIHSLSKSDDPLQYDLADVVKPVIVDRVVFRIIRKKQIKMTHFKYLKNGGCYLNEEGMKLYLKELDALLSSSITLQNRRYSYRSLLNKEVYKLEQYIRGNTQSLKPFIIEW